MGGMIAIAAGIYLLNKSENAILAWFSIAAGVVLVSLVVYAIFILPALLYRSQSKLKDEYRLEFSDEGIGFQTKQIDANLKWSFYHSWLRDDEFYILFHGNRDVSVIPRRSLTHGDDELLMDMLSRKMGPSETKLK